MKKRILVELANTHDIDGLFSKLIGEQITVRKITGSTNWIEVLAVQGTQYIVLNDPTDESRAGIHPYGTDLVYWVHCCKE
ncbi:MAG: hypothetical protein ABIJ20_03630 [Nanoarchaeota archaeon]|nr:hypothetical protein [Nanoarchaeota archaeon]MBU1444770.1 hypothetical protein [Nanoarchaeota archaeon]MBU2406856.1 hypothetical protein [Nanoarchaeota archaeon]MBU2420058.1 hypothetical protein [Nanoarchaeota archaeon]MBU2474899.1 hypothetical protein [Nanoarchaeota archaeon]